MDRLSDRSHNETAEDTFAAKALREAGLLVGGTLGGMVKGAQEDAADPLGTTLKVAGAVGVGLALGAMERGGPLLALGAKLGGTALAASFVTDVLAPRRIGDLKQAFSDTWASPEGYSENMRTVQESLGRVAFDTALMTGLGVGTKALTEKFILPESKSLIRSGTAKTQSVSSVLDAISGDKTIKWGDRNVPSALARYFEEFPHRALGHVETGKDNIVIELTGSRMLKISNKPMEADHGHRFFDLPYLERGKVAGRFDWIIQPKGEVVHSKVAMRQFDLALAPKGYNFWDMAPEQLVRYKGEIKLHDYDAVSQPTSWKKKLGN